jgi:hypothetical protein
VSRLNELSMGESQGSPFFTSEWLRGSAELKKRHACREATRSG